MIKTRFAGAALVGLALMNTGALRENAGNALATPIESFSSQSATQTQVEQVLALLQRKEFAEAIVAATKLTQVKPTEPIGFNLLGLAYIGAGAYAKARMNFNKALDLRADFVPALANLAEVDLVERNLSGARKNFGAVLAHDKKNLAALVGMARVEAADSNDAEVAAWLNKAEAMYPDEIAPKIMLAKTYMANRNYEKAMVELTEARRIQTENADVLDLVGQVQTAQGNLGDAVATFERLITLRPDLPEPLRHLASAQLAKKDIAGASASLNKALMMKPDDIETLSASAMLEVHKGRYAEAISIAKKIQALAPKDSAGFALEGDILFDQKQFPGAVAAYQKAIKMQPTGITVMKLHAAQSKAANSADADTKLKQWVVDHPNDVVVTLYLAQDSMQKGRNKEATEQYEKALQRDQQNVMALNNLALLYRRNNDRRAITVAEQAYKLRPDSAEVGDTLGWILTEYGQVERAVAILNRAATQSPNNTEIHYHLAAALAKAGDKVSARKELQKLLTSIEPFPERDAAEALLRQL